MTYDALIDRLLTLPKYSDGVGFRRMAHLLAGVSASEWWRTTHHFHIVGTDGKGSTAALLSALIAPWAGGKVGRYTSPHLLDFSERIVCDGQPIAPADLLRIAPQVLREATEWQTQTGGQMAAFEVFTAVAVRYLAAQGTTVNVWEAGIGGRLDPTRWLRGQWAGLTSVGLDHTELLGPTKRHIALDKMEVLGAGGTLVVGVVPEEVRAEIDVYAQLKEIEVLWVEEVCEVLAYALTPTGCRVRLRVEDWELPEVALGLRGAHQLSNLRVALLLLKRWLAKHRPEVSQAAFAERLPHALKTVHWPGRFQKVHEQPAVYVDVGHTAQAYEQVAALVRAESVRVGKPVIGIVGISRGKAVEPLLDAFEGCLEHWVATEAQHRAESRATIAAALSARDWSHTVAVGSPEALQMALNLARTRDAWVVVVGSLFLAVEVAQLCAGKPLEDLRFF